MFRPLLSIAALALSLTLISCASPKWQMQAGCPGVDVPDAIAGLTALVTQEGMNITLVNEKIGVLQAATAESADIWTGHLVSKSWQFTISHDTIYAFAKEIRQSRNAFGTILSTTETYYNDKVHKSHGWYWNVRNGIGAVCENAVVVFVKKS